MAVRAAWPTIASIGMWSPLASYMPVRMCWAPGPLVAMQTPISPVNFAWADAMKAAISSWRAWTNSNLSPARFSPPIRPRMPSPG